MIKVSILLISILSLLGFYLFFLDNDVNEPVRITAKSSFDPNKKINYLGTGGGGWSNEITVSPTNPNIVFVGSDNGGLFKSTNGGETWIRPMGAYGSGKIFNFRVCGVEIDPLNPNTVWAATAAGPFKSTDLGDNWKYMGGNGFPILNQKNRRETNLASVYVHPTNSNLVYLGLGGSAKHRTIPAGKYFEIGWKSTDGGQTWKALGKRGKAPDLNKPLCVSKIAFSYADQNIVYFATNQGLFKSNDGGESWKNILSLGFARSVDVVKDNPKKVFCAIYADRKDNPQNGIWFTTDGGNNWKHPNTIENIAYENSYLGTKPCEWMQIGDDNGKFIYAAVYGRFLQSTDGGSSWEFYNKRNQRPNDPTGAFDDRGNGLKQFFVYEVNKNIAYTDGTYMTLKTTNHGEFWLQTYGKRLKDGTWTNNGYVNTVVDDALIDGNNIFLVDPDIGLQISTNGGSSWQIKSSNRYIAGASSIIKDYNYYYVLFGSGRSGGLFRAEKNNPFHWELTEDFTGRFSDYSSIVIAENKNIKKYFTTFWSSKGGLYWSNTDNSFQKMKGMNQSRVNFIYQDPNNTKNLYVGLAFNEGGGLFRSSDFGNSWSRIDSDVNGNDVYTVVVKPGNSNLIIKGVRGYSTPGKGGSYRSTDFGKHWNRIDEPIKIPFELTGKKQQRWVKSLSYTKDDKLVMALTIDSDAYWYPGIYISSDDGTNWSKLNINGISGGIDKIIPDPNDPNILWICSGGTGGVRYKIN